MSEPKKSFDPRALVFLGCTIIGVGVGFLFFPEKLFVFIGCIVAGPGVGLL
jgi:hypothetical protein